MSQFLHQLRSEIESRNQAEKRRSNKRRQHDKRRGPYDRRSVSDVRKQKHSHAKQDHSESSSGVSHTILNGIKHSLERIAANQEKRVSIEERKARAMEKIAEAMENTPALPLYHSDDLDENVHLLQEHKPRKRVKKQEDPNRKRVIEIIDEMRKENATYSDIAERLQMENLPTFSGRGKWHAQTVHRLCSD